MTVPRTVRGRSVLLLDQRHELLMAVEPGELPSTRAGPGLPAPDGSWLTRDSASIGIEGEPG